MPGLDLHVECLAAVEIYADCRKFHKIFCQRTTIFWFEIAMTRMVMIWRAFAHSGLGARNVLMF